MNKSILIIDDNEKLCRSLCMNFTQLGFKAVYQCNGTMALQSLASDTPDIALLDVALGEEDGLAILKEIKMQNATLPVIMITGFGTIKTAVDAIKAGAFDYVQKPLEFNKLLIIVENAIKKCNQAQKSHDTGNTIFRMTQNIVTANAQMIEICNKTERLANTMFPLLIQGESGTGKEGMAEFIHSRSARSDMKLLKINCAAFSENLLDNELFGHEKGAYTGAHSQFQGVFEKADGGTLLLDEIGDMSLATQAKILRALQNHEIRRIGSSQTYKVDVRFIASTNKDLKELIRQDLFREDLYYRLSTATIHLPPLKERKDDIPLLVTTFLKEFNEDAGGRTMTTSTDFMDKIMDYDWPGNIRELKNTINYAAAICTRDTITAEELPPLFHCLDTPTGHRALKTNERKLIEATLQQTNYNKKKTAELLQISRKTLYNKLERYGLL